jgi:hypothetical protein
MEAPMMEPKKEKKVATGQRKKHLKEEYARGQTEFPAYVFPEDKYREYILSISLFPNLYNRANVLSNMR